MDFGILGDACISDKELENIEKYGLLKRRN